MTFRVFGLCVSLSAFLFFLALTADRASAVEVGRLKVSSAPENGATVIINGVESGVTPAVVEGLPEGPIAITVQKAGYQPTVRTTTFPARGELSIVVELSQLTGEISFESDPRGARVFLDGDNLVGETPLMGVKVPVGEHTYEIRKDGYGSVKDSIVVEADYRYTKSHKLAARAAKLVVFSKPSGAKVWINEDLQDGVTPLKFDLVPETYTISAYLKGYLMGEVPVTLGINEEKNLEIELRPGDAPENMVLIPAGPFVMGGDDAAPDEKPRREMDLPAFFIDKYEVTNEQWKAVFPEHEFVKGQEKYAVTGISYNRAQEYAKAVGKRLPTEEEWEKAARGTDGREYPWGNEFDPKGCCFRETDPKMVHKIGQFRKGASPYGCMDMSGNAYEWTANWYQAYPGNPDVKKEYGQVYHVLRGGSFLCDRFEVRCARRHYDRMDASREDYGLRLVRDAPR